VSATPAGAASDLARLERRRRLTLRWALAVLGLALLCWPLALLVGEEGNETREVIGGAFVWLGVIGLIAGPWILRAWPRFMERHMLDEVARAWPEISHLDGERDHRARAALASDAFQIDAFQASGLAEPFAKASVDHVLTGRSQGVPFALAQLRLFSQEGYSVFGGVLASFRLPRPRPGLTIITRERGLLGNLIARAGSGIERVALEDPQFEGVFEAYGFDQVQARVVLTATMLERLKALDELAHARGFTCAFRDEHLLIAFEGMRWRCALWRVLQPVQAWLPGYRAWLEELIELPARIVATLDLHAPSFATARPAAAGAPALPGVAVVGSHSEVFTAALWRLVGQGGIALVWIASGALFGGLAATFGWWWWEAGFEGMGGYLLLMILLGLAYGAGAIAAGLYLLARLAWAWGAPLRSIPAGRSSGPSDRVPNGLS
jgi:hypothetical protein